MKQEDKQAGLGKALDKHLTSPLPLIYRLRTMVFGENQPDRLTKFAFYSGLVTWFLFFFWHVLQFIVVKNSNWIEKIKRIPINELLEKRALELGFEPTIFIDRLLISYSISIISWSIFFVGLVLLWRRKQIFSYVVFTALGVAIISPIMLLGFTYWKLDISSFDKITEFSITLLLIFYSYLMKVSIQSNETSENQL